MVSPDLILRWWSILEACILHGCSIDGAWIVYEESMKSLGHSYPGNPQLPVLFYLMVLKMSALEARTTHRERDFPTFTSYVTL